MLRLYNEFMTTAVSRHIDEVRRIASGQLDQARRGDLGQFMTSSAIADFMASLFQHRSGDIRLLDPGAGVGSLSEAFVRRFKTMGKISTSVSVTAYEIDPILSRYLKGNLAFLGKGPGITTKVLQEDFISSTAFAASFGGAMRYTHIILNPPYRKISANSPERKSLQALGVEAPNLYVAFLAIAVVLVEEGGEIVAIIPRSFCNGLYFRQFRKWLLERAAITHIHVFESRKDAFQGDGVLQENIIIRLVRGESQGTVNISHSKDATFKDFQERTTHFNEVVKDDDSERYIHIPFQVEDDLASTFPYSLEDLGIEISTGPVVDFRVKEHWLREPAGNFAPLLYTHNFLKNTFQWPRMKKKPDAIRVTPVTEKLLMPRGWYVVTKRFSSKEEKRRIVAYVVDPCRLPYDLYGFENHLNVFHVRKRGLSEDLALGLALFLNSTLVDSRFRTFSGHTQVNATDMRTMRFPAEKTLIRFGICSRKEHELTQQKIDMIVKNL